MDWRTHQMLDLDGAHFASIVLHHRGVRRGEGLARMASAVVWTLWTNEGDRPYIGSYTLARGFDYQ